MWAPPPPDYFHLGLHAITGWLPALQPGAIGSVQPSGVLLIVPGLPGPWVPAGEPCKMKLVLLLPWACCCLCGSALATGFLYPFPAAALPQHGYPEQGAGSPGNGYSSRR